MDGVMDWIHDAELFVSSAVEGTYEAVKERTDRLEVNADFYAVTLALVPFLSFLRARSDKTQFFCVVRECFNLSYG